MNYLKPIILLLAFFAFIAAATAQDAKLNQKAPDFTLTDSDGNTHSLSDFAGKYVVLEWINYGCPFVKKHYETDNMQELQKKYTDKGVIWLAICSSAEGKQGYMEPKDINQKTKDFKAKYTAYLIDTDGTVGKMYGAKVTPHMFIIDKSGKLVYAGGIDNKPTTDKNDIDGAENYVDKVFKEIFDGKDISTQTTKPYGCSVKYGK